MTTATSPAELDRLAVDTIRTLSMDAVERAGSGHPGTPMALAPLAYVLFTRILRHDPADPDWPDRDRFVLSAGHASMLLYSTLHLAGYDITLQDLRRFRELESPAAGHPERGEAPGVEVTTGPLGQGFAHAVGMALAERMLATRFNRPGQEIVGHHTYVVASDGDMMEGITNEAASLAGHLGLGRLVVFYDDNHITIDGDTELAFSEDVGARFEALGWHVQNLGEDIGLERLEDAARAAQADEARPSLVVLRTHIAPGSPNKQDTAAAHGAALGEEEVRLTKEAYGWPSSEPFHVPSEALAHVRDAVAERAATRATWQQAADRYAQQEPERWADFRAMVEGRLPDGWADDLPRFAPSDGPMATRKASSQVLQWAAAAVPTLVGGSADLGSSANTVITAAESVGPGRYGGRNLHFGVREHAMGAVVNGLTLHGFRAYGSTFLIFSDYLRPSTRLAALMELPSIFVFTHDSIGLGEDGPTHQPIEQLAALRAMPNLLVIRPADANETAQAWRVALAQRERPSALALSRQNLPVLDFGAVPADGVERGAYVLSEPAGGPAPDAILIGTGGEVHVCTETARVLGQAGVRARVVSMPCAELFAEQPAEYREAVLPRAVRARVAVEAASPLGWDRWVGEDGDIVGMRTFGASAPAPVLFQEFGFTPDAVADRVRAVLDRVQPTG